MKHIEKQSEQFRMKLTKLKEMMDVFETETIEFQNIPFAQCQIVMTLVEHPGLNLNQLAQKLKVDNSTISRTLQRAVDRGLVDRREDKMDRRSKVLYVTSEGEKVAKDFGTGRDAFFGAVYDSLPNTNKESILASLQVVIDTLDKIMNDCEGGCEE